MKVKQWIVMALLPVAVVSFIFACIILACLAPIWISQWANRDEIRQIYDQRLIPTAAWVREFTERTGRLPTNEEVATYSVERFGDRIGIIHTRPAKWEDEWLDGWPSNGREFVLGDSIPEWNLYYCSWNNREEPVWTD